MLQTVRILQLGCGGPPTLLCLPAGGVINFIEPCLAHIVGPTSPLFLLFLHHSELAHTTADRYLAILPGMYMKTIKPMREKNTF